MGWLKDLDLMDAALFITLFALSAVFIIAIMSVFTNVESNGIVMIVLGKLMALLDAAIFFFFQNKKNAAVAAEASVEPPKPQP